MAGTASALPRAALAPIGVTASRPAPARAGWRIIPQVDRNPWIVTYVQGVPGRICLVAVMAALAAALHLFDVDLMVAPLAAASAYTRSWRRVLIPLITLALLAAHGFWINVDVVRKVVGQEGLTNRLDANLLEVASLAVVAVACAVLMTCWPRLAARSGPRRPTLCLILGFLAVAAVAQSRLVVGMPRAILWGLLMAFQPFLWFLAYALADLTTRARPVWQHLGVFHPFWGSSMTPFGKGLSYLERYDAKTPEELAVTQLKGVKLACWTLLVACALNGFDSSVHGLAGLPRFNRLFLDYLGGLHAPRIVIWASLVSYFVEDVLNITVWGGAIVACARMAGFRLLRNTYRPLEARTLAEFWNRYYFFYKELLVDHFFYPVFLRCFRRQRRLRVFFATFMAACVGNLLFHFIRDIHFVAELGWKRAVVGDASHAFYTFLLAVGVGLSQLGPRPAYAGAGWLRGRVLPSLWIVGFFCVLHVFDAPIDRVHTIGQRMHFLFYLLGIDAWI